MTITVFHYLIFLFIGHRIGSVCSPLWSHEEEKFPGATTSLLCGWSFLSIPLDTGPFCLTDEHLQRVCNHFQHLS